tara:strand:- start:2 stop:109 length:108 start_codon:yes stop_codon:yes gene_type:complete
MSKRGVIKNSLDEINIYALSIITSLDGLKNNNKNN